MSNLMEKEPQNTRKTQKNGFMEKLLDLSADQAGGVEVEWKALGDVVNLQRGRRLVKSQLEEIGEYAVYQNAMKPLGYYHESNVRAETTFIICAGAAGEIGYSNIEYWAADDVHSCLTPDSINDKFLYHFLLTQQHRISAQVRRASIPRLSKTVIEKLLIPIPCPENPKKSLEIQAEIVRILDKFTELTAELTARKKQYNYYRDQLLSFEEGDVEWKMLGELADNLDSMRKPITSGLRIPGEIPYYGASGIVDYVKAYIFDGDFWGVSHLLHKVTI